MVNNDSSLHSQAKQENKGVLFLFLYSFRLAKPYWKSNLTLYLALLLSVLVTASLPLIYQEMFNKAIPDKDSDYLTQLFLLMGVAFILLMILDTTWGFLTAKLSSKILCNLRARMFQHLQYLPLQYFSRVSTGDTISRFSNDLNALENFLLLGLPRFLLGTLIFILSTLLLFFIEWRLALLTLMTLPLTSLASIFLSEKTKKESYLRKENEAEITTHLEEIISLQTVIRAFSLQHKLGKKFLNLLDILQQNSFRLSLLTSFIETFTVSGINLSVMIVIGGGALLALKGIVSLGTLIGFFSVLLNIVAAITLISAALPEVFKATGALCRIEELLSEEGHNDSNKIQDLKPLSEKVCFENVCFSYDNKKLNLDDIHFNLHKGQSVAFVGPSGSGKSTILKMILKFYPPNDGKILWDGEDLEQYSKDSLRSNLGVVFQDTALLNISIKENIRMGKLNASDEEVIAAAKAAEIHQFANQLPQGYDTMVGEHGSRLSGGQRQRIAIARAILRKPEILILDEATAALDAETEASINSTLLSLTREHSVLCVTHRLALIENFDMIYVLKDGKIFEYGNHATLLEKQSLYFSMWQKQNGFFISKNMQQVKVKPSHLKTIPLFYSLDDNVLEDLSTIFVTERYPEKQIVFKQGEIGEKFYIIAHGSVKVIKNEQVTIKLQIGDYFGEIALIRNIARTATIQTVTPCILLSTNKRNFQKLLNRFPELLEQIEKIVELRIKDV